jgi:hypothetical protein
MTCDGIDGHVFVKILTGSPRRRTNLAIEGVWNNINWGAYRYVCVYYVSCDVMAPCLEPRINSSYSARI